MTPPVTAPDKRRKILDAAVRVFASNGYYSSKVSHIAREAGVADGTIYLYFKNKEDLLIQVFLDTMDDIVERQRADLATVEEPVRQLERFIDNHYRMVAASPALAEVLTVEVRQSSKFMRSTDMRPFGLYLRIIADIVERGQARGDFDPDIRPRRVARALFGVLDEYALEWAMGDRQGSIDDLAAQTRRLFLQGLLAR